MKVLIPNKPTSIISIGIIWLFHICGMIGISYGNKEFFLAFTPINLFISFVLLFINQVQLEKPELNAALIIFFIGMISEILGVNYGLIFGDYVYLDNLGFKVLGVPVLIGVNWIILTFITGHLLMLVLIKVQEINGLIIPRQINLFVVNIIILIHQIVQLMDP